MRKGETFATSFSRLVRKNCSASPRGLPTLLTGQNYNDVPDFLRSTGGSPTFPYCDPSLRVNLCTSDDNESFFAGDRAIRLAAAAHLGDVDLMGAYAFRERGNYFGNVQCPFSKVHAKAYNAEYKWQPGSRWIDFRATAWANDTVSDTYSSGGFANSASVADPIIINSAIMNARNDRFG
ncbi:Iron siderophore receptor protein [Sphingomonas sp. LH128]|nr:Iron siderophore receptor protein [Sphingomonas sp. LH128]